MHSQVPAAHYVKSDDADNEMEKIRCLLISTFVRNSTDGLQENYEIIIYLQSVQLRFVEV